MADKVCSYACLLESCCTIRTRRYLDFLHRKPYSPVSQWWGARPIIMSRFVLKSYHAKQGASYGPWSALIYNMSCPIYLSYPLFLTILTFICMFYLHDHIISWYHFDVHKLYFWRCFTATTTRATKDERLLEELADVVVPRRGYVVVPV